MTPRLDLRKVIAGAFLVPWWRRRAFARALAIPLALIVGYSVVWYYYAVPNLPQATLWLVYAVYGLLFTLFAVTCHRLVLLDTESVAQRWRPAWSRRETRFFLWIAALWLTCIAVMWVILALAMNIWTYIGGSPEDWFELMVLAVKIAALYVFARLCMLFPATAVDRKVTWRWSWDLTRDNGWRLFIIVGGLPLLSWHAVGLLHRDDATTVEWFLLTVLTVALFAVEIAAISLSYRELTRHDPQSTAATT